MQILTRALVRRVTTTIISGLLFSAISFCAAIVPGFNTTSDGRNDDGTYTTGGCNNDTDGGTCDGTLVPIGFNINFFGMNSDSLYINTNGNVTLDYPLSTFTPFGLDSIPREIIAPFFADVDTRNTDGGVVTFGNGTFEGHNAFGVNWINIGYYDQQVDKTNSFQLLLVDRSDTGAGNFTIIFNYNQVQFEAGDASHGTDGLGGDSAEVGFSSGTGDPGTFVQLPGSGVPGSFIDGGTIALTANSLNSNVLGRYIFDSRAGMIVPPSEVPEPSSAILFGAGITLLIRKRVRSRI